MYASLFEPARTKWPARRFKISKSRLPFNQRGLNEQCTTHHQNKVARAPGRNIPSLPLGVRPLQQIRKVNKVFPVAVEVDCVQQCNRTLHGSIVPDLWQHVFSLSRSVVYGVVVVRRCHHVPIRPHRFRPCSSLIRDILARWLSDLHARGLT